MKRISKYLAVAALSLGASSLFAQDDVYYNPKSNQGTTQPSQTDYQQQYETSPTPASNANDYDYKRDGYSTTDPSQYSGVNNTSSQTSDSYYDDDYFFDDFSYSGRLNRFYQPHSGLGYWNNFYDPFYWNRPTIIVQTSYYNPWWSNWRYNICNVQPWRCQVYSYGNSWGGGWNNGWINPWMNTWNCGWNTGYGGGWNYGFGGGWNNGWGGNPYMNGYQAGFYNGYYNGGYNNGYYNGYYNGGYNNGYGDYSHQQNYSYYGPRKQSGAAGSNTTDGQIKRAEGKAGKTDETDIPRQGLVRPIDGRAAGTLSPSQSNSPSRPTQIDNRPSTNGNTGVASPGQLNPGTPMRPTQGDLRPSYTEPRQIDTRTTNPRQFESRPQPTEPRQIETTPSSPRHIESIPQPSVPRQMETRPSNPRQMEIRTQPSQPRQMESRPSPSRFESSPTPSRGSGGGNFSAPNPSNGGGSRSPGRVR